MKTHARTFTISALLVPLALSLATLIANEAQTLLGLHLDNVALSLYLLPFLAGVTAAIVALVRLEVAKIGGELGGALSDVVSSLFGQPGAPADPVPLPLGSEGLGGMPLPPEPPPPMTRTPDPPPPPPAP